MARKRPSALDALGDVAPPQNPAEAVKAKQISSPNKPATYRLPKILIYQLRHIANIERVKISEMVTFALQNFIEDYEAGEIILPKADPRYNLDM